MNLMQQMKLAFACARAELIKVGKNLPRLLHNFDKLEHEEEQVALHGDIGDASSKLSLLIASSSLLTHGWYSTNTIRVGIVLVLEGPSGLGTTQFSMSLSPRSLEATCSNCEEPDLREFKLGTHELVCLTKQSAFWF